MKLKEGWQLHNGEKIWLQKINKIWHMWSPWNGWHVYEKKQWSNGSVA